MAGARGAAARSGFVLWLSVEGGSRVSRRKGGGGAQRVCVGALGGGRAAGLCWGSRSMAGVRAAAARSGFVLGLSVEGGLRVPRRKGGGGAQRVCVGAVDGGRAAGLCLGCRWSAGWTTAAAARSGFVLTRRPEDPGMDTSPAARKALHINVGVPGERVPPGRPRTRTKASRPEEFRRVDLAYQRWRPARQSPARKFPDLAVAAARTRPGERPRFPPGRVPPGSFRTWPRRPRAHDTDSGRASRPEDSTLG